jgi:outer membrane protein assembly factor BamB
MTNMISICKRRRLLRQPAALFALSWAVGLLTCFSAAHAENWPAWRGPRGDGTSLEVSVPTKWNATTGEGIAWKVLVPGRGHSSPIVWNDQIFLATCLEETNERVLLSFDRRDGHILWQQTVLESPLETKHQLNSFASGTPTTDGQAVYVSFLETDQTEEPAKNVSTPRMNTPGSMVVAAYNMEGKQLWVTRPSPFSSVHGFCSSPVIFEGLLIINGDHDGEAHILALDRKTGDVVWKFPRVHQTRSYCTPIIREVAGKTQMVLSGSKQVISLDPRTGDVHWTVDGPTEQFVASMVFDGSKFYLSAGFPDHYVMAIRPDGNGNVTETHVQWSITEAKCYVPSPVLVGNQLFVADDRGTLNCFDTKDGNQVWVDRLGGHFSASLITANGLVYCTADDGTVSVVQADTKLNLVSTNPLDENSYASPAVSQGQIFIRGEQHLFAVGESLQKSAQNGSE